MQTTQVMESYYNLRAQEYEKIYQIGDRQEDIKSLSQKLQESLSDRRILEVACGTGFWTQIMASSARSILALDQSLETLEIARTKKLFNKEIQFIQDDAYTLAKANDSFNAAFAGFWWSHISKNRIIEFLKNLHGKLMPGAKVLFFDNQYIEGISTPINRTDIGGNTYQLRTLADGSRHEIIKNFPTDEDLKIILGGLSKNLVIHRWKYYWMIEYEIVNSNGVILPGENV